MNIFIDHVGDGHKYYRMAITSILYNECLRRRCLTKKGNVAQVEFYNNRYASIMLTTIHLLNQKCINTCRVYINGTFNKYSIKAVENTNLDIIFKAKKKKSHNRFYYGSIKNFPSFLPLAFARAAGPAYSTPRSKNKKKQVFTLLLLSKSALHQTNLSQTHLNVQWTSRVGKPILRCFSTLKSSCKFN